MEQFIYNPVTYIFVFIVLVIYLVYSSSDNGAEGVEGSSGSNSLYYFIGLLIFIFFIVNWIQYAYGISAMTYVSDILSNKPKVDLVIDTVVDETGQNLLPLRFRKEVFNVPGNKYNYLNAKAICSAYGAKLANYKEVEDSYNAGEEWCNYGWSEGQMALFPTQQKTFHKLQKSKGHENDCGRPGVNGGYMANPELRFGVNCYGVRPKNSPTTVDTLSPAPMTPEEAAFQQRVDFWKTRIDEIEISP